MFYSFNPWTLGRTSKLIPPSWYKGEREGGGVATLPWVFAVLQHLGNILFPIYSLIYDLQDKVTIMGYGTAGGP